MIPKKKKKSIRAVHFKVVHFHDPALQREIVLIYALGEDGIVREFSNNKWTEFPIEDVG